MTIWPNNAITQAHNWIPHQVPILDVMYEMKQGAAGWFANNSRAVHTSTQARWRFKQAQAHGFATKGARTWSQLEPSALAEPLRQPLSGCWHGMLA